MDDKSEICVTKHLEAMDSRYAALVGALITALIFTGGAYAAQVGPFEPDPSEPMPTVQSLTITDRGCRGEIPDFDHSKIGGNGTYVYEGVIKTRSPATELTAKAIRTSPENADIITYRIDLRTHTPTNGTQSCKGEIAYRLVVTAPTGPTGERVGVYINGRMVSCGGGTYGSRLGCKRLLEYHEHPPEVSTNGSARPPRSYEIR